MAEEKKEQEIEEPIIDSDKILESIEELKKEESFTADKVKELVAKGIQKGVNISKDQYNKTISSLKSKVKEVSDLRVELEKKVSDAEKKIVESEKKEKVNEKQKAEKTLAEEIDLKLKDQLEETTKKLALMEEKTLDALERSDKIEADLKTERLNSYKLELISKAEGKIIAEMVSGNTREEIEEAVKKAKDKYEEIANNVKKTVKIPGVDPTKKEEEKKEPLEIKRINIQDSDATRDYRKKRDEVRKQIYREAGFPV